MRKVTTIAIARGITLQREIKKNEAKTNRQKDGTIIILGAAKIFMQTVEFR